MAKGSYLGGSTTVRVGSNWFSGHPNKKLKDDPPATKADLEAGRQIRAGLNANRPVKRQKRPDPAAPNSQPPNPSKSKKEERRLAHARLVDKAARKKKNREVQQIQEALGRERRRIRKQQRLELEADPVRQAKLANAQAEHASKRMKSVVVERRTASGKVIVVRPASQRNEEAGAASKRQEDTR